MSNQNSYDFDIDSFLKSTTAHAKRDDSRCQSPSTSSAANSESLVSVLQGVKSMHAKQSDVIDRLQYLKRFLSKRKRLKQYFKTRL